MEITAGIDEQEYCSGVKLAALMYYTTSKTYNQVSMGTKVTNKTVEYERRRSLRGAFCFIRR